MKEDLIKREDALNALIECDAVKGYGYRQMEDAIRAIPSADRPQGEWIPCSERLPENRQYVVLWDDDRFPVSYVICRYSKGLGFCDIEDGSYIAEHDGANAWMPLPKPWKGAADE
jgi:hypothetical protein